MVAHDERVPCKRAQVYHDTRAGRGGSEWHDEGEDEEARAPVDHVLNEYEKALIVHDEQPIKDKMKEWKRDFGQISSMFPRPLIDNKFFLHYPGFSYHDPEVHEESSFPMHGELQSTTCPSNIR